MQPSEIKSLKVKLKAELLRAFLPPSARSLQCGISWVWALKEVNPAETVTESDHSALFDTMWSESSDVAVYN